MPGSSPVRVFEALADPVRRAILELVSSGEQTAGALVAAVQQDVPITQPAVSQHLKVLREAGLVRVRVEGTRRIYTLDPDGIDNARYWLAELVAPLEQFTGPLEALATEIARGKRERRAADIARAGEKPTDRKRRHA
ncbi:ArsR/SmtB family transcription factor [Nocardia paucivorans]|uniref:ArsR/SmtB family transcription factor n=1 Tax=Nocardia paucivorans TaxID=114259 RepID=UPI0002F72A9A|nr:metalloregulator ArsR/SmtB family transcription factor [Nocardia paucivorans]